MTHDWSHLDEAAARGIVKECYGTDPDELTDHPASKSWEPPSWPAWERLEDEGHYARKAIFDALTPSDLAALIAEKCPGWVAVPIVPSAKMAAVGWAEQESGGDAIDIFRAMVASSE